MAMEIAPPTRMHAIRRRIITAVALPVILHRTPAGIAGASRLMAEGRRPMIRR